MIQPLHCRLFMMRKNNLTTHLQVFEPVQGLPRRFIYSLIGILVFIALIPLLVVSFLLIQFIRHGHGYYKVTKLKFYIRFWMYNFLFSTALDTMWIIKSAYTKSVLRRKRSYDLSWFFMYMTLWRTKKMRKQKLQRILQREAKLWKTINLGIQAK